MQNALQLQLLLLQWTQLRTVLLLDVLEHVQSEFHLELVFLRLIHDEPPVHGEWIIHVELGHQSEVTHAVDAQVVGVRAHDEVPILVRLVHARVRVEHAQHSQGLVGDLHALEGSHAGYSHI